MITLTTDFGSSEYVGAMKGVIYSINPDARIVDLTHGIRPFDVRHGAWAVYSTCKYFSAGSVHLVVVDPGVGTLRKGLILCSGTSFYIGPDNGVFSLIDADSIYEITSKSASTTFHGRDVFAPVSARLDLGEAVENMGVRIKNYQRIVGWADEKEGSIKAEVLCVDYFGNVISNIKVDLILKLQPKIGQAIKVGLGENVLEVPFVRTYGDVSRGKLLALINSSGVLELTCREGRASDALGVNGGKKMEISL